MTLAEPPSQWRLVYEFARREVVEHFTTKRVWLIGGFFAFGFLTISVLWAVFFDQLADAVTNQFRAAAELLPGKANIVLYLYYILPVIGGFLWIQLLGLTIAYDGVVGEWVNKSLVLVLSKPVTRASFVIGKFVGGVATVGGIFFVLLTISYVTAAVLVDEVPSVADVGRAYLSGLVVLLALTCFVSLGLFWSTVLRTTGTSMIATLGTWLIGLPLLARTGFFIELARHGFRANLDKRYVEFFYYLDPGGTMKVSARMLFGPLYSPLRQAESIFGLSAIPDSTPWSIVSMALFTLFFLALSVRIVQRRDYE